MFEVFGMSMSEFISDISNYSDKRIKEAIEEANEEAYFLDYENRGNMTKELSDVIFFIESLERELEIRKEGNSPKIAQIWAYAPHYGFVSIGKKTYPFTSTEQCKAIITSLYKSNLMLQDVQLIGRGQYEGTLLTQDVNSVINSL